MKRLVILLALALASVCVALWNLGEHVGAIAYAVAGVVLVAWLLILTWRDDMNAKDEREIASAAADAFIQRRWDAMADWRAARV